MTPDGPQKEYSCTFTAPLCTDGLPPDSNGNCFVQFVVPEDSIEPGLSCMSMSFDTLYHVQGYGASIYQGSPVGIVELYDGDELVVDRLYTLWQTSGNVQSLSNPHDVYAWAVARVKEYDSDRPLRVEIRPPAVRVTTSASDGDNSELFAVGFFNEFPIGSASIEYIESSKFR